MISFKHGGSKYRIRFAENKFERGSVRGKLSGKYLRYTGITVMLVDAWDDSGEHYEYTVLAHCSEKDTWNTYKGRKAAYNNWLQEVSTRSDGLRKAAWEAWVEQAHAPTVERGYIGITAGMKPNIIDVSGWQAHGPAKGHASWPKVKDTGGFYWQSDY